jgi:hypothetical protein
MVHSFDPCGDSPGFPLNHAKSAGSRPPSALTVRTDHSRELDRHVERIPDSTRAILRRLARRYD